MSDIIPLIVILSCKKNSNLWNNLLKIDINSIIFYADPNLDSDYTFQNRILCLKCKDTYDALPEKILMMIGSILQIEEFKKITHIYKLDDHDTKFNKNLINDLVNLLSKKNIHYGGQRINNMGRKYNSFKGVTRWHIGKCDKDSIWNNKAYDGDYTPWADGGTGYILSRKVMNIIKENTPISLDEIRKKYIYEDLMIALILYKVEVYPQKTEIIIKGDK